MKFGFLLVAANFVVLVWGACATNACRSTDVADRHRILFFTLEYADPIFSGNGVLSRTMVRSLADEGHKLLVVCATPDNAALLSNSSSRDVDVIVVPVAARKWLRLDRSSAWQEFASAAQSHFLAEAEVFNPSLLLAVDWSGWHALKEVTGLHLLKDKPSVYLPFRVFSQSSELVANDDDRLFYLRHECRALQESSGMIALSHYDARRLHSLHPHCRQIRGKDLDRSCDLSAGLCRVENERYGKAQNNVAVLWPPIRSEVLRYGRAQFHSALLRGPGAVVRLWQRRKFITCCVRLSREKNAMLFADLAVELSPFLRAHGLALRLCGAAADVDYAAAVKARLANSQVDVEVWDKFSSARKLMEAFETSILNIHPSLHDAFGMTVLEAASVATPSLLHSSQAVGVGEALSRGEVFRYNLTAPIAKIAEFTRGILSQRIHLARVGRRAQRRALTFTPASYRRQLATALQRLVP